MSRFRLGSVRGLSVFIVVWLVALADGSAKAQLDTRHWIPPLWAGLNDASVVDNHFVYVSTPEVAPVAFTITDGAGNRYTGTVSNAQPVVLQIGKYQSGYGPYTAGGWSGAHTAHVLCGTATLNQAHPDGLVVEAERPVYVSIRQRSASQGEILASPGRKGLGKEFRALFARNVLSTSTWRGSFISVMATEPGVTRVTFDGFKPGVKLFGAPDADADGTTDTFTIELEQYQSWIVGVHDVDYTGTAPLADLNGTRITSDRLVTATSGYFLGGPSATGGQDAGFDQLVPTELAGTEYVMIKGNASVTSDLETVTVVAMEDGTDLFVNGESTPINPTPLAAGGWFWVQGRYVGDGLYLRATRPVQVVQGIGGSDSFATPGANIIPPIGADASSFVDNIPQVDFYGAATVGIVTRAGAAVTVNGLPPLALPQPIAGNSDWVTYKLTGLTGSVAVASNAAVSVSLVNVSGNAGLAGYFSGFPSSATLDLDQDDTVDGGDNCPDDPNADQLDDDHDGVGNLCDQCDDDPSKAIPGLCGCGKPEGDADQDGVGCDDNCPRVANPSQADEDHDGIGDACADDLDDDGVQNVDDPCPLDPKKVLPGACGCGLPETDSDLDGLPNCVDPCPIDPSPCTSTPSGSDDEASIDEDTLTFIDVLANDAGAAGHDAVIEIVEGVQHGIAWVAPDQRIAYIPNPDYSGLDSLSYRLVVDGRPSELVVVALTIVSIEDAPIAAPDQMEVGEGESAMIDVLVNDVDADGDSIVAELVSPPAHGTLELSPDGHVRYTHDGSETTSDTFAYRARDAAGVSEVALVTITVLPIDDAPVALADVFSLAEGGALEGDVLANDDDPEHDPLSAELVSGPLHGTLTFGADGVFLYAHDGSETTSDVFRYQLRAGEMTSATVTVTLVIAPTNDAPQAKAEAFELAEGATLESSVLDNDQDEDGDALVAELVSGPLHGTLVLGADGTFVYVHDGSETSEDRFSYVAFDGRASSEATTVTLVIAPIDDAPIAIDDDATLLEGESLSGLSVLVNDRDAEGDALTAELVTAPRHGNLTLGANGYFTYLHDGSETAADSFEYRAFDGTERSQVATVTITIVPSNDAPIAVADVFEVGEGEPLDGDVLQNDEDAEGATLAAELVSGPSHGTLALGADGRFVYVHDGSETSEDTFSYVAFDGISASDPVAVTLTVSAQNDLPTAAGQSLVVEEGGTLSGSWLASAADAEGATLAVVLVDAPAHGQLTLAADGAFSYVNDGAEADVDGFTFRVDDGSALSDLATVTITIVPSNDAPVAVADVFEVGEGERLDGDVLENDEDAEGVTLVAELVTGPSHGTLVLGADGHFVYVHDGSETSEDTFSYVAFDGISASDPVAVTLTVSARNDLPTAAGQSLVVEEGGTLSGSWLASAADAEGAALAVVLVDAPAHGQLTLAADGAFSYVNDGAEADVDGFTFRVDDGSALSDLATVTITIVPSNDAPVGASDRFVVVEGGSVTGSVVDNDVDVDSAALTVELVQSAAHGTLVLTAAGTFSYVHDGSETRADAFSYRLSDGTTSVGPVSVAIEVTPVNDAPVGTPDRLFVVEGEQTTRLMSRTSSVLANDLDADGDALTALLVAPPANGSLVLAADGTFTYTHDGSETLADAFVYRADDGVAQSADVTVTVMIMPANDPPVGEPDALVVDEGASASVLTSGASSLLANDHDAENAPLSAVLERAPSHGSVVVFPNGELVYSHDGSETLADAFSYRVSDRLVQSAPVEVTISVRPMNDAPVARPDSATVSEGAMITVLDSGATSLIANDSDDEAGPLWAELVTPPARGQVFIHEDGTFQYRHDGSEARIDAFSYRVRDASAWSAPAIVTLTITPENDRPVGIGDTLVVMEGGTTTALANNSASVLANDFDADHDPLVATLVAEPEHGVLELAEDGTFRYTHDGSESLSDLFVYLVDDGQATSDEVSVTIAITPVNEAPVAHADVIVVSEGGEAHALADGSTSLLDNDSDADGNGLVALIVELPTHGALTLMSDGTFSYQHDGSEVRADRFAYRASDGTALSETVVVTIQVAAANDAPVGGDDAFTVVEGGTTSGSLLDNDSDTDGVRLTVAIVEGPQHGTLTLNADGTFDYVHDGTDDDADSFVYVVDDGLTRSEPVHVTITIVPADDAPTITVIADQQMDEDGVMEAVTFTVADSDSAVDDLVVSWGTSDSTLVAEDGIVISGEGAERAVTVTPEPDASGTVTIRLIVSDGILTTTQSFALTIRPVDDAPSIEPLADLWMAEDTISPALPLRVSDRDSAPGALAITASSSDPSVVPPSGLLLGDGTLRVAPAGNASGAVIITVRVSDALSSVETRFVVQVTPVNDAPTVVMPPVISVDEDGAVALPGISIGDLDAAAAPVTVALVVGHGVLTLTRADGVQWVGGGNGTSVMELSGPVGALNAALGTLTYAGDANFAGADVLGVSIDDGGNIGSGGALEVAGVMRIVVTPIDDRPTLGSLDALALRDPESRVVPLELGDVDDLAGDLTVTLFTSDDEVMPLERLLVKGSGATRGLRVTSGGVAGTSTVTVAVSDASGRSSVGYFVVTVTCLADFDGDGLCDTNDGDRDGDGVPDGVEVFSGTSPEDPDSDDDGLSDGHELDVTHTDPTSADSDEDGVDDGQELADGTDPLSDESEDDLGAGGGACSGGGVGALPALVAVVALLMRRRRVR